MSESAMTRVRGAIGGTVVGIVLLISGATSAGSNEAAMAVIGFFGACGVIFYPGVRGGEPVDF